MKPRHSVNSSATVLSRQIGRKVLKADHLAHVLSVRSKQPARRTFRLPALKPKMIAAVVAAVILVTALGIGGAQFYFSKTAETQKIAAAKLQTKLEAKSIASEACRQQKLAEKADQIGKITYAELYDGNACDK
jgi:uncharacterized protein HemX